MVGEAMRRARLTWLGCFLCLYAGLFGNPLGIAHADALLLQLDRQNLQLGHAVNAYLYLNSATATLAEIDLRPLAHNFGVVTVNNQNDAKHDNWPASAVQLMHMRLYPRRIGELTLPSLQLAGSRTREYTLKVSPGEAGGQAIEYSARVSATEVWQREQILYTLDIVTTDRFASLRADETPFDGFESISFAPRRLPLDDGRVRLRISWALYPLAAGKHILQAPAVAYRLSGVEQRMYFPAPLQISVRALPAYIPPTMPVGRVTLRNVEPPRWLQRPEFLDYWRIELRSDAVPPHWMPPILRQLQSNQDISYLNADSTRASHADNDTVHHQVTHNVPFKTLSNGGQRLASPRLQYFDPRSGRLHSEEYTPPAIYSLNVFWRLVIALPLLLLLGVLTRAIARRLIDWRRRRIALNRALYALARSRDAEQLRTALRQTGVALGWRDNLSLGEWLACWRRGYESELESGRENGDCLGDLLNTLSSYSYGTQTVAGTAGMGRELASLIRHARKKPTRRFVTLIANTRLLKRMLTSG